MPSIPNRPDSPQGRNEPVTVGAVTTALGEQIRLEGVRVLTDTYHSLENRARRRQPTPLERRDLAACEAAILELERMGLERG